LKKKRKKEKAYFSPFAPARPAGPPDSPASGPPNRPFFFFSADADTWAPLVSLSLSPLPPSPPCCPPTRRHRANPAAPRLFPSLPLHQTGQLRQLTPPSINWGRYFPLAPSCDGRRHQWQRHRSEPARLPSPSFLWPYLSSCSNSCASLCLLSAPTHSLEHQFPSITASGSRRRRRELVAAGEG
jgi:hypothetical protein